MNPHFWWYLARGSGISSWFFGGTSLMTGLLLSSKATLKPRPNWQLDLHRYQGAVCLSMVALHISALVADSYSHFTLAGVFIPFASSWKSLAVAWGIVAMYLLLTVEVTSLLRKRLSEKVWHVIHLSSLIAYLVSTAHFFQAGTDHRRIPSLLAIVGMTGLNLGLLSFRVLAEPRALRSTNRQGRVAEADQPPRRNVLS